MLRGFLLALPALLVCALATPARAENWVTFGDPWIWDDLDSVTRNGSLVTWNTQHSYQSGVSPAIGGGGGPARVGVDCSTRQWYDVEDGVFGPGNYFLQPTRPDYVYFCVTTAAPPPAAVAAPAFNGAALLRNWRIEDMAAAVRRQNGTTDGVTLTDARGQVYLNAQTTTGRQFSITGRACAEGNSPCYGAYFNASMRLPTLQQRRHS